MDREENKSRRRHDPFHMYRHKRANQRGNDRRPIKNPRTLSTADINQVNPKVKRQYRPSANKRYRTEDLTDQDTNGSLWSASGQQNFLFAKNKRKKHGDIVVLKVQGSLKNDIARELAIATPSFLRPKKPKKKSNKNDAKDPSKTSTALPVTEKPADAEKIYDHISTIIVDEIRTDHLLVRGRKKVLYKKKKRLVEIQALVNRRDISDDDSVLSSRALETNVAVLR